MVDHFRERVAGFCECEPGGGDAARFFTIAQRPTQLFGQGRVIAARKQTRVVSVLQTVNENHFVGKQQYASGQRKDWFFAKRCRGARYAKHVSRFDRSARVIQTAGERDLVG